MQGGGQNGVAQEEVQSVNELVGNSEQLSSSEIPNNPTVAGGEGRAESGEVKTGSALGETDAPGDDALSPAFVTQERKGGTITLHTKTETKKGVKTTRVVAMRNGSEVLMPRAAFPVPEGMTFTDIPEGVEVIGVKELREGNDGRTAATVLVMYGDGSSGTMETRVVKPAGETTLSQPSDQVGDQVADGDAPGKSGVDHSLSQEEAQVLITEMEANAEVAPEIELTIENWDSLFGEDGLVETPIGEVKMGENQFTKLMRQGRDGKLGMVKPTLENPDVIIEDESKAKNGETERPSSYVFVKSFKKADGSRYYYFTSVTVSKDGKEVIVSNQEKRRNAIANLLTNGKLVWKHADNVSNASDVANGLYSSQGNSSDLAAEGTDAPQTNVGVKGTSSEGGVSSISHTAEAAPAISLESRGDVVSNSTESSASEDINSVSNSQENTQKSGEIAENGGEKQPRSVEEDLDNGDLESQDDIEEVVSADYAIFSDMPERTQAPAVDVKINGKIETRAVELSVPIAEHLIRGNTAGQPSLAEYYDEAFSDEELNALGVDKETLPEPGDHRVLWYSNNAVYIDFNGGAYPIPAIGIKEFIDKRINEGKYIGIYKKGKHAVINTQQSTSEIQEPVSVEDIRPNGDKRITNYNSRGEVATVATERDGKVVSVDSYDEGVLFEHTEYDGNGKATSVTRYDKSGNVVGTQAYENGKLKGESGKQSLVDRVLARAEEKRRMPLRERAKELEAQVGVKANIIESLDEVKNREARKRIAAGEAVAGWYSGGQVYLYMPNIKDKREIELTYVHEVVAHHGVKKLLGDRFNEFLDGVWNMMSEADRARMLAYVGAKENPTLQDMRAAADEYVAELAEKMNLGELEQSTWEKIVDWFKKILENIGFKNLTKEDIESMLKASYSNLRAESGKGETGSTENDFRARMQENAESKKIFETAKEVFGTTYDMREAGYILPDGTMLDFSGKHQVRGVDNSFLNGNRTVDHREIEDIAYDFDENPTGVSTDMGDFLDRGAIRIDYNVGAINLNTAPTAKQKALLKRLIERNDGDVTIDFGKGWDTEHYAEYESARASRVLGDIDRYYSEGIKPGGNTMFRISRTPQEFDATQAEAVEKRGIVAPGLNEAVVNVVDVPRHNFTGRGRDAIHKAEKWANENIAKEHTYHEGQEDEFKYTIDEDAISKFLSSSSTGNSENLGVHLAALKELPNIIDNSVEVEVHPDYQKKDGVRSADNGVGRDDMLVHRLYGAVNIDGRVYRAKTTIHEFRDKANKAYDYKITEIELIVSGPSTDNARTNSTSVTATKLLEGVEKSYDKGKKVLVESENSSENPQDAESGIRFRKVTDPAKIAELETGEKIKTYRAMALIDGKLYPPMSSKSEGVLREPSEIGVWEEAEENPGKAKEKNGKYYFTLTKDNGKSVRDVAYNPYLHSSTTMLNDQFKEAQSRDNLVVVEMEIPTSELTSGYKADKAHDTVGTKDWKAGTIQGQLTGTREVVLSRWGKPVRIVPVEEVAENIKTLIEGQVEYMPTNVVTPQQRKALEDLGVKFVETNNNEIIQEGKYKGEQYSSVYGKKAKRKASKPMTKEEARRMVRELVVPFAKELREEQETRFRKRDSERRQEKRRINDIIDTAAGFVTVGGKKQATKNRLKKEAERKQLAKEMYSSVLKGDFNDVTLSQIDKFIEDATPANPFGRRISQRLPQRMERALRQGARTNAVDALFSRICESTVPANERFSEAGRREIEERKKELLKGWAIATGNWHTDLKEFTDDTEPIGEGKDSKVYMSKDGNSVIKASKGKPFGKKFRPDIDNIPLFNDVFKNSRYEILGYGEIDGQFVRILKQDFIDFAESTPLTQEERKEYMGKLGFKPLNKDYTAFSNGEIVIADLQKSNIVKDAAGNISVIDADAKLHTKDVGGDYTYPPVEEDLPEQETRFRTIGGNSGYVGYSMSKRAAEAREEGRYPKTDFKKEYGVSGKSFDLLQKAGIIYNSEWHHTSKFGNRTDFYSWDEPEFAEYYAANKKRIDKAINEVEKLKPEYNEFKAIDKYLSEGRSQSEVRDLVDEDLRRIEPAEKAYNDARSKLIEQLKDEFYDLPEDSGTRFRIANENQEVFVSNAQRAVEGIQQNKATAEQWIAMLKKNGGLKAGEDAWMGLEEWLNERGKVKGENGKVDPSAADGSSPKTGAQSSVTKQEVLDFIAQNRIQIEEVNYTQFGYGLMDEATRKLEAELKEIGWDAMVEKYPGFDELFEVYNGELLWSEERASVGEYEDFIIDNKIVDLDSQSNAINETREKYTTEGLERKREIALTVPTIEPYNASDEVHFGDAGEGRAVAWVRFGETTDSEGNRVLVIDEIQSKRHQEGREKGYRGVGLAKEVLAAEEEVRKTNRELTAYREPLKEKYNFKELGGSMSERLKNFDAMLSEEERITMDALGQARNEAEKRLQELREQEKGIPSAPFEKNWHELAMKRMLRLAAEEGFDKVAWTTGEQQAERYDMSKVVSHIECDKVGKNGNKSFSMGLDYKFIVDPNGIVVSSKDEYVGKSLADIVGKPLANKMLEMQEGDTISGNGLRIGGEGMKGFYDKMLPSFVQKYTKKWGAKVGEVTMPSLEENNTMWSVDVTPEMQESVMEGQTMFRITPEMDAEYMSAVENGDMDTAERLVKEAARLAGYISDTSYQGTKAFNGAAPSSNGYFETKEERANAWNEGEFDDTASLGDYADNDIDVADLNWRLTDRGNYRRATQYEKESIDNINEALRNLKRKIKIYRAVPADIKEGTVRNGDWITPSRSYAEYHIGLQDWTEGRVIEQEVDIDDIWWDGNDINEWGYDDGSNYVYRNTKNNRKLLAPVTYDNEGNVIPLSERFNEEKEDIRFRFIGEKGAANLDNAEEATTRLDNLAVAREMETAGKEAKAIKLATGWERGADGKWRYETPDELDFNLKAEGNKLMDYLNAPELYAAYPELKDAKFEWFTDASAYGEYDGQSNTLRLNSRYALERGKSTLAHEIQHAIQEIEGFARGGNPRVAGKVVRENLPERHARAYGIVHSYGDMSLEQAREWANNPDAELIGEAEPLRSLLADVDAGMVKWEDIPKWFSSDLKNYESLAGEVESRNVQERMNMTPEERRNSLAEETTDVARKDQIFIYENLGESAMGKKKTAPETVSVQDEHLQTVVSSADGAKVLKDLDNAIVEYENDTKTKEKTFLGNLAKVLNAKKHGSNSQYATFEAMNGKVFTIRLANHNATVSTFDNHDESEGISIVVTAQDNNGITNDGNAHLVEFFYDAIKLRKADGKPLVEILKSIKQALYSGEYKDNTGLAEVQEVNSSNTQEGEARFRTVEEGTGGSIDDVPAQPLTLMERITNSLLEVSANVIFY